MSSLRVKISCLLVCLAPATMMNAFAAEITDAGYYAGFMLGPTKSSGSGNSNSFGGRVFGGYEANPFISYEMGVVAYPQSSADSTGSGCTSSNQRVVYLDALLKGSMPLGGGGIYTKVGAATNINPPHF